MILITGGTGYIGSHIVYELLSLGSDVIVLDNFSNSHKCSLLPFEGKLPGNLTVVQGDILDITVLDSIFSSYDISFVIHLAGLKSVPDSFIDPISYFKVNFNGTVNLVECMSKYNVYNLVFSSTATIYGDATPPVTEECNADASLSPYGHSKRAVEQFLHSVCSSDSRWSISILRYFNPVGAHPNGLIGEYIEFSSSGLFPSLMRSAEDFSIPFKVFGLQHDTADGSPIRDFIHVVDLAKAHVAVYELFKKGTIELGYNIWNVGTGTGYSVLQVLSEFCKVTNIHISPVIRPARAGDISVSFASVDRIYNDLGWRSSYSLTDMVRDAWNWHQNQLGS